jgi:hypothetical protein
MPFMSKRYLVLAAFVLLGLSGLALARSVASDPEQRPDQTAVQGNPAAASPLATPAGMRWLQGQPTHWRALLLHHE